MTLPTPGPPPTDALLSCRGVEVSYGSVRILFGIDLDIAGDEIVALLGTNGAGKSTLLKAISGLVKPTSGSITFDGQQLVGRSAGEIARAGIIQVPGGKATFPTLSVADHFNAASWLVPKSAHAELPARTEEILEVLPRLRERWGQLGGNLSGGEQQQLALALAFVARPRLLIIDELSLGLAPAIVEQLIGVVRRIHASGCAVVVVEQSVNVALTLAQRAYFLEKGEVRFSGPTADLLGREDILHSVFLQGAASRSTTDADRSRPALPARAPVLSGQPALRVDGLRKSFGGVLAVDGVSFDLAPGEVLGLIGPNGAGKTTIFDLLSGLITPDAGRVTLGAHDVTRLGPDRRSALGLGRSYQDARLFSSLTVREAMALGLERHLTERDLFASLFALPAVQQQEADVAFTVEELIELLNLGAYRDKFIGELSTGSRRIVDLAMSIAHEPDVLLLDEPSSGIAQRETEALAPLLRRIRTETGAAILIIEHDMPLITEVSDEIIALELGAVVVRGSAETVLADPRVISAYLGGDTALINRSGALA